MKLSSTPKPVRIRISLCGKEHTSLESLKENISPDIIQFTDGRLQRWLKQQNLNEISEKIQKIADDKRKDSRTKLLKIYNCLTDKSHKNLLYYIDEWKNDVKSKELLKYYFKEFGNDVNVLENNIGVFSLDEWYEIISPLNDSRLDFYLAKQYDNKDDVVNSIRIFEKIKERGDCPEADLYYKEKYYSASKIAQKEGAYCLFDNSEKDFKEIVEDFSKCRNLKKRQDLDTNLETYARDVKNLFVENLNKLFYNNELIFSEKTLYEMCCRTSFSTLRNEILCLIYILMVYKGYDSIGDRSITYIKRSIPNDHPEKPHLCGSYSSSGVKRTIRRIVEYILLEKVYL